MVNIFTVFCRNFFKNPQKFGEKKDKDHFKGHFRLKYIQFYRNLWPQKLVKSLENLKKTLQLMVKFVTFTIYNCLKALILQLFTVVNFID